MFESRLAFVVAFLNHSASIFFWNYDNFDEQLRKWSANKKKEMQRKQTHIFKS
jgi:hypothetical protein